MDKRDMALSFQEKSGCDEIWEKICEVHGKDTSTRITSSRSGDGSGGGGMSSGNDNLDESDEDQLDSDGNTSPSTDLPVCELSRLKEIRDFFVVELMRKSNPYKEKLTSILETENYIKRLIDLFHICEDLENLEGLNNLFEIFRSLFYLNKSPLLDILLCDDLIMEVIGCLEYDPSKTDPIKHREYIATKAQFKEVIPFDNADLVNKIHQTYRVQYIQDVILPAPSVFEENSLAALNSFIFLNKVEIANLIQEDERFLNELFESLKNTDFQSDDVQKRRDMFQFLKEYISFLHGLQQAREPLYQSLYSHGILTVVEVALNTKDEKINTIAIEIFSQFVEVVPTLVREFILKEVESRISLTSRSSTSSSTSSSSSKQPPPPLPLPSTPISSFNFGLATTPQPPSALLQNNNNNNSTKSDDHQPQQLTTKSFQISSLSSILNLEDDSFEPVLINFVIRQMINDPDQGN
jgi:protein phosphatase 4 regulatory subunit 3